MTTGILLRRRFGDNHRGRVLIAALVAFSALLLAGGVALSWRRDLPDPVATHWSGTGTPDGFMALGMFVGGMVGIGATLTAAFAVLAAARGQASSTRRTAIGSIVWLNAFLGIALLGSLWIQRDLDDARSTGGLGTVTALAIVAPLLPAVAAALLVPRDAPAPATGPVAADAPRAALGDAERAVWLGRASGGPGSVVAVGSIAVTTVLAVATQTWVMLTVPALLVLLLAAMLTFTVRVDATGLTVRSALGWPRTHLPADEVERADRAQVRAFAEFGGWGWRVGRGGRTGVVLRSGDALEVRQTNGRAFVVTVDGADQAAALLNTLADRSRTAPGGITGHQGDQA
ncbi:DUF1648 domain-containing protein [Myceligenerans indicum]|uniref:DUF1648 domain-containing protein n=1 Tax=Myceligenerans indicum TaxID=2593663 RepID=A0ABS1LMD8_9MICO|nr:DUF1648 domain-containing protein [Myceligenerans indicum]MBL0887384.1 DUF1648 domain-containing protein [Myceligenerans indicum]